MWNKLQDSLASVSRSSFTSGRSSFNNRPSSHGRSSFGERSSLSASSDPIPSLRQPGTDSIRAALAQKALRDAIQTDCISCTKSIESSLKDINQQALDVNKSIQTEINTTLQETNAPASKVSGPRITQLMSGVFKTGLGRPT